MNIKLLKIGMKRFWLMAILLVLSFGDLTHAQSPDNYPPDDTTVVIDRTNLPIVWIDVDGQMIDRQERISARMKIIHNGKGRFNYADTIAHPGQTIDYEGPIALRYRGNSSFAMSDKKPYSFRTLSQPLEMGYDKKKVSILGMGKDNNWALLAPYSDRSMIRDLLAFELARPWMEYTPQGRLCEVYLDGTYYGVYILCEVVSKGKHRLNLDDPGDEGDALTGGYMLEVASNDGMYHISKHHPVSSSGVEYSDAYILFQYKIPDYEDMTKAQVAYINQRVDEMEDALASPNYKDPELGYRKYIDVQSFIDYQLSTELSHNPDGYRLSAKFYKRRDSIDDRFKMVIWDMNLAYGNCRHNNGWRTDTWISQNNNFMYPNGDYLIPFWWYKFSRDGNYTKQRRERWTEYRENNVRLDRVMATIDSLANEVTAFGAEERNAKAWPRWGVWVWPNYYVSDSYQDEIDYIKDWITRRIEWIDKRYGYVAPPLPPPDPEYLRGDINGDGQVNIADINVLVDIILGGEYFDDVLARADVNEDREINIADISVLIDIIFSAD